MAAAIALAVTATAGAGAIGLAVALSPSRASDTAPSHTGDRKVGLGAEPARHRSVPTTTTSTQPAGVLPPAPPTQPVAVTATSSPAPVYSVVPTTNRVIFLGIDDGIVQDPRVLAFLRGARIPFSVFLVKTYAQRGLAFWQSIEGAGGTIESHTLTHSDLTKLSTAQQRQEICGTLDPYQQWFGRRPTLFRPPYGTYDSSVRSIAASCGFKAIVMWKGATNDGRLDLQDGTLLKPGDILLMHWRTDLLRNLQVVIAACRAQGFTIARLEDYLSPGS